MKSRMLNSRTAVHPGAVGLVLVGLALGCLPEDTRPEPATIYTEFALAPHADEDLSDGLTFETVDGYEVTFSRVLLTLGRVTFSGDECNAYSIQDQGGFYSRVMDALQPDEQLVGKSYAIGQCSMGFMMSPPEDWAHTENPGVSTTDRDSLRAVDFPGQGMVDEFSGPRGSKGASLRVVGQGRPLSGDGEPTNFIFEFPTEAIPPLCAPEGQDYYDLTGGSELTEVIEMTPQNLLGTCGDSSALRFAPIARAGAGAASQAVTLKDLEAVEVLSLSEDGEQDFYQCDFGAEFGAFESEESNGSEALLPPASVPDLSAWLNLRAAFFLFGVRGGECNLDFTPRGF